MQRSGNITAGAQLVLLGIVIPLGYVALRVMFFNAIGGVGLALALVAGLLCVLFGVAAIVTNRARPDGSD